MRAAWAARAVVGETARLVGAYRCFTGDTRFDDLLAGAGRGYVRFLATGEVRHVEAAHSHDLNQMRFNWPMVTSEVRGTDRVALAPRSLLGPLTGSSVSITEPPSLAVTWREVNGDFTALVRSFDDEHVSAWAYSFGTDVGQPEMRFWRLAPGQYELRAGPDADGDGKIDGAFQQKVSFDCRERADRVRFDLPAKKLWLIEVVRAEARPVRPARLPDLAAMSRDISLKGKPEVGNACEGQVVVHNIGSADANDVTIVVQATPDGGRAASEEVARIKLDKLASPADLVAKRAVESFTWKPRAAGTYRLDVTVSVGNEAQEICSRNNRASIAVRVGPLE